MTTDIPAKPAESGRLPAPSDHQPSGKAHKKENLGPAIAKPEGFPSSTSPQGYFKENLEPALRSAVKAGKHDIEVLGPGEAEWPRVFAYLRGSTEDQEGSIYSQVEDLLGACEREEFRLTRVFWDLESGRKGSDDRPGLAGLKEAAAEVRGTPAQALGAIVWHMNRFSRSIRIGLQDLLRLSDLECPVIFPRRRGRLLVANMDDSGDVVDAVDALADASDDFDEHVAKIQRGMRTLLRNGIHPTGKGDWMYWVLRPAKVREPDGNVRDVLSRSGQLHQQVVRRIDPLVPYASMAAMLQAYPEYAVAQAMARAAGRSTASFLDEMQLRWAIGDFRFGVALDDPDLPSNPRDIAITDVDTFERVSHIAERLESGGRRPGRESMSRAALNGRAPEYWIVRREDVVLLCRKPTGKGKDGHLERCDAVLHLKVASSTIHPGKDLLKCRNGHTRVWPPSDVAQHLAGDHPPFCAKCGSYAHVEIEVQQSTQQATKFRCTLCGLRQVAFGNFLPRPGKPNQPRKDPGQSTL